jgi:hypothetical protein
MLCELSMRKEEKHYFKAVVEEFGLMVVSTHLFDRQICYRMRFSTPVEKEQ